MKYFSFYVVGGYYCELTTAPNIEKAKEIAHELTGGNDWGLHEISHKEYESIRTSWKNKQDDKN
jgi:peptidoglycan/xylan/chitin deacetylase (PgdA/CDA1 family)